MRRHSTMHDTCFCNVTAPLCINATQTTHFLSFWSRASFKWHLKTVVTSGKTRRLQDSDQLVNVVYFENHMKPASTLWGQKCRVTAAGTGCYQWVLKDSFIHKSTDINAQKIKFELTRSQKTFSKWKGEQELFKNSVLSTHPNKKTAEICFWEPYFSKTFFLFSSEASGWILIRF